MLGNIANYNPVVKDAHKEHSNYVCVCLCRLSTIYIHTYVLFYCSTREQPTAHNGMATSTNFKSFYSTFCKMDDTRFE